MREQTWRVRGAYGIWTLTIAVEPVDDVDGAPEHIALPPRRFDPVAEYFIQSVNHYELIRDSARIDSALTG